MYTYSVKLPTMRSYQLYDVTHSMRVIPTYKGEVSTEHPLHGLAFVAGEAGLLHGLPELGVLVTDRVVPHRQLGTLHRSQVVVQGHVLPDPATHDRSDI